MGKPGLQKINRYGCSGQVLPCATTGYLAVFPALLPSWRKIALWIATKLIPFRSSPLPEPSHDLHSLISVRRRSAYPVTPLWRIATLLRIQLRFNQPHQFSALRPDSLQEGIRIATLLRGIHHREQCGGMRAQYAGQLFQFLDGGALEPAFYRAQVGSRRDDVEGLLSEAAGAPQCAYHSSQG